MIYEMKLKKEYFDKIQRGEKIYEVRLNDEKRKLIGIGDIVVFKQNDDLRNILQCLVEDLIYFDSFKTMAKSLPKEKIGFANESTSQIIDKYHEFYSTSDETKYGVVAIKIKVLNNTHNNCNN